MYLSSDFSTKVLFSYHQDKIELQEFSLGSCPPTLGDEGMRWITSGDQVSRLTAVASESFTCP